MIFYYPKLHELDLSTREALILSVYSATGNKPPSLSGFFITNRWLRTVKQRLINRGIMDRECRILVNLPRNYKSRFIILYEQLIADWGLNTALLLCYCRGDIIRLDNSVATMLGLSRATFFNCKKKLKRSTKLFENVFKKGGKMIDIEKKKLEVQQKYIQKFNKKVGSTKSKIAILFLVICAGYNYKHVPHPTRADIAKATNALKNVDIPEGEILERLISNWDNLKMRNKPKIPDLGTLPLFIKELIGMNIKPKAVESKPKKSTNRMTDEDIEEYIQASL